MNAPTTRQLEILKLMNAGARLLPAAPGAELRIIASGVAASMLLALESAGWITFDEHADRWRLTDAGRDLADVKAFVRAFTAEPR